MVYLIGIIIGLIGVIVVLLMEIKNLNSSLEAEKRYNETLDNTNETTYNKLANIQINCDKMGISYKQLLEG